MGGVTNGWLVVYVGDEVEDKSMVAHDKVNEQWELQGLTKRDELGDIGHLVPMK
jgi:hypothetical protein